MPPKKQIQPSNEPKTRTQKIEEYLLDPDKVIFESMEEFRTMVSELLEILGDVDFNEMEMLVGEDGKTPVRGVDYMTDEDLKNIEAFILSKIPKVGVDLPSRVQVESYIRAEVAKIPRVTGPQGPEGKKGKDGTNGSPDSGLDILRKLRALPKNQRLGMSDVRGLENTIKGIINAIDGVDDLIKDAIGELKFVVPANQVPGGGEGGGLTAAQIRDLVGAMFTNATHSGCTVDYDDIAETITITVSGGGGGGLTEEEVEDVVNGLLVAGTGITLTYNDGANTLTVALSGESFTSAMKTKVDHITVTQAVDLDAIETNSAASKVKTDFLTVTQPVDLDAIETRVNALDAAVVLKGTWDASAGTFPGGGTAQAGDSYIVSVGGTVNGQVFVANDRILAIVDNASTSTYAANWHKLDYTDAVLSVAGKTGAVTLDANDVAEVTNKRYMTDAQETKLDSVESNADVTDAANVGAVNAAATSKGTPIDADSFPIVDSAASNAIKRVTFTNLKAFLKTYIDAMTSTFTNKTMIATTNVVEEITTTASSSTPTPTGGSLRNLFTVTALAAGATFAAPSGTPANGNRLVVRIKDNGTARSLAFNAIYRAIGITLPTTTVISKTIYLGMIYNSTDTKWDVIAYALEA